MAELVKCIRCKKTMIAEEYDNHRCIPAIKGFRTIKYATSYSIRDEQNRKTTTFRGIDGIVYDFIEIPENKEVTKILYQPIGNTIKNSTEDETEPSFRCCQIYGTYCSCKVSGHGKTMNLISFPAKHHIVQDISRYSHQSLNVPHLGYWHGPQIQNLSL